MPNTAQTMPPAAHPAAQTAAAPTANRPGPPAPTPARQAQVTVTGSLVTVSADDSSLNQILREIGRLTGMKITGGVADERVFGTYGPADSGTILAALLRGTGSNMLLIADDAQRPRELVLTPRNGGPTPPSPASFAERQRGDRPPQFQRPGFAGNGDSHPQPAEPLPQPVQVQPQPQVNQQPATPIAPASTDTSQQSPNGVKTPQQIYDQLMQMQQQQQKPPQ
jgi:hypothetical protein